MYFCLSLSSGSCSKRNCWLKPRGSTHATRHMSAWTTFSSSAFRRRLRIAAFAFADRFNFDTKGLDTVMTATIIGVRGGSEISFTMRMREVSPAKSDLPRRDYPPPTAVRVGLDKTWDVVDREIAALPKRN